MKISVFLALSADVVFYGKNRGVLHSTVKSRLDMKKGVCNFRIASQKTNAYGRA